MILLLELLECMDWLSPLRSLLNRNVESITVNTDEILAVDELKRRGVKVRRLVTVPGGRITFDVPVQQVGLAKLLLRKQGLDMRDGPGRPWHRAHKGRKGRRS